MELWVEGQELHVRVADARVDPDDLRRSILDMIHEHRVEVVRVRIDGSSRTAARAVAETGAAESLPVAWTL